MPVIYDDSYVFELGRGSRLREGGDVTLMGIGIMVQACLDAAALLAQDGIEARVLNLGCLKPLDWELVVDSARRTGAVVTAEEHMVTGGLGDRSERNSGRALPGALKAHRLTVDVRHVGKS